MSSVSLGGMEEEVEEDNSSNKVTGCMQYTAHTYNVSVSRTLFKSKMIIQQFFTAELYFYGFLNVPSLKRKMMKMRNEVEES